MESSENGATLYKSKGLKRQQVKEKKNHRQHHGRTAHTRTPPRHRTNHPSLGSGMGHHCNLARQFDYASAKDQIQHKAQDFTVTDTLGRKTIAARYRDFWEPRLRYNPQIHSHDVHTKKEWKKERQPRFVDLPCIYKKLCISNISYALSKSSQYDVVINVSGEHLMSNYYDDTHKSPSHCYSKMQRHPRKNVIHINMPDQRRFNKTKYYVKIIDAVNWIIESARENDQSVLITCFAGTNRSVFLAIAFALMCKTVPRDADYWINYIEKQKKETGFDNWDTLSNLSFVHMLKYTIPLLL